jgi:uncharacterized protein (TIGR03437 family)
VKHAFRLSRACAPLFALVALFAAAPAALGQTISPTPDTAIFQITSTTILATPTPTATATPTPTPSSQPRNSFANDISGSGRFVVIESAGDIATDRSSARNNADGNQEIFLFDYAQRRVFQITNTKSALKSTTGSTTDQTNIDVQVVNLQPVISHDGRFIVFESNAYIDANASLTPKNFDGQANAAALKTDGNTEIFIYRIPDVTDIDLSQGTEVPVTDLAAGTMTRVTFTPASSVPRPGSANVSPFFARDNYGPTVGDDGALVAFVSSAKSGMAGVSNADGNKEVVVYNRAAGTFVQVTTTADVPVSGSLLPRLVFNDAPSLSACVAPLPCRLAFASNADIGSADAEADKGNAEVYAADLNATSGAASGLRQLTHTPPQTVSGVATGNPVNLLSPGRRISRDGARIAFESLATYNADGTLSAGLADAAGIYIINVSGSSPTFAQVATRAPSDQLELGTRWPTFTGDGTRIVWASNLNLTTAGAVSTSTTEGLNTSNKAQVFSAPVDALTTVARVTNLATGSFNALQPFPADTIRRMAISLNTEQGGGNSDQFFEAFYQLIPTATSETPAPSPTPATSPAPVSFLTGASARAVVAPSPVPSPPDVSGLAPGMLGIARSPLTLAPTTREVDRNNAHESQRRPPLPVELAGVTVTVSGSAAGLFFASANQLNFVVPPGLATSATAAPVVIFNNGTVIRASVLLNAVQPDVFTSTNAAGGRAAVVNVTNPCIAAPGEPFAVTTTRPAGSGTTGDCTSGTTETAATRLLILVTGLRPPSGTTATVTVRIGTTDLSGTSIISFGPSNTPGFDQVIVELPASLAGAGDVPVIVSATAGGTTFTSRPADSAPRITIQ